MRRGRSCAAAPPMRARVHTRAGPRLRGGLGVGTAGRRGGSIQASEYIDICVCVCALHAYTYIIHLSVYVRIGRRYACVQQCAMVMDRLCAHALAGSWCGLVLKAETLNRASRCPSASTACGFGAQAFSASAFNANIGAWNTAAVTTLYLVCACSVLRHALRRTRSAGPPMRRGLLCAGAPPMGAPVRTRVGTRLRGALGAGMAARRGGSIHASEDVCVCVCVCVCVRVCVTRVYVHTLSIYLYMWESAGVYVCMC